MDHRECEKFELTHFGIYTHALSWLFNWALTCQIGLSFFDAAASWRLTPASILNGHRLDQEKAVIR